MSASLLEYFKAGPPAPKVVLLPDTYFFVRAVPIADASAPDAVAAQVALALETCAPFPVEHLNHGFYWVPGATQALAFAAYRRRFTTEQIDSWAGAELVVPAFVAVLGLSVEPATTVLVPGHDSLTAVHWHDSPVPAKVLVQPLPPEATAEDRARVRDELLREVGGSKKIVDLPALPGVAPSPDENEYLFQAGDNVTRLPAAQAAWLDVRPKDELAALRQERARDLLLWRVFLGCVAALVLFAVGEVALIGGRMWQKTRTTLVEAQRPGVEKTLAMQTLTNRIEDFSTKRLLPIEMITLLMEKRPALVQFNRFTTGLTTTAKTGATVSGLYQIVAEAQTSNAADVTAYEAALNGNTAVFDRVEVENHGSRNGLTTFKLTVTFKPEALKPGSE
jgi:hypothetical protein